MSDAANDGSFFTPGHDELKLLAAARRRPSFAQPARMRQLPENFARSETARRPFTP
jgi:hypothetical protein